MNDVEVKCKWIELKTRPLDEEERKEYEEFGYNSFSYDSDGTYITYMWDCELPEDGEEVLVTNGKWVDTDIFEHYYDWNCSFETYDADEITHWMRLPIPPQKKENIK